MNGSESPSDKKEDSRKQKIAKWLLLTIVLILVVGGFFFLSINANIFPDWTGLPQYVPPAGGVQRQQTLVDWLDLLLVPVVLAIAGFLFSRIQKKNEEEIAAKARQLELDIAKEERKSDRLIALESQRQQTLENYLDRMKELVLDRGLGPDAKMEVVKLARTLTLNVLRELGSERNKQVIQFLQEADLLGVVSLAKSDLSKTNLSGVNFRGANLDEANLREADLSRADLRDANLSFTNLIETNLSRARLRKANLFNANLIGASLRLANLSGANLSYSNLREADMAFVFLKGTDLSGADLSETSLDEAMYNKDTLWPTDFNPVEAGANMDSEED